MDESRTQKLHEMLRRLGKAVHSSVARSGEVRECLSDLHDGGWRAVMLVETSLACEENGEVEVEGGTMRLHVDTNRESPEYRIGVSDVSLLSSLGIAPGKHRANGAAKPHARAEHDRDGES